MDQKKLLTVLALGLVLFACGCQAGTAAPSSPTPAEAVVGELSSTPASTQPNTPIPSASATPLPPDLPAVASPDLARIDFQDENYGWGIAVNEAGSILRTIDGGMTWLDATPPEAGPIGHSTILDVLNSDTAWVLIPGEDFFSGTLHRTRDGGVTWNSNPAPFGGGFLQFLDASTGRMLADRGAGAGSEAVEIFQTSDGGASWVSVFHNDPTRPDASESLPLAGIKNGMTFRDADTGWVPGSIPVDGEIYLYKTLDGGISWLQQELPLPPGYAAYQYTPQAPVFFGDYGLLPLMIHLPERTNFTIYSTQDGGLTWSGDPLGAGQVIQPGVPAFADALHAWSWDGGSNLYMSNDGARTWQAIPVPLDLNGRLAQLEFVPSAAGGFTGWALTQVDDAGHSQLYRTRDGSTWTALIP
jgi:photosystem II stability/assembly factor-like uncharacterized protein